MGPPIVNKPGNYVCALTEAAETSILEEAES